MVARVSLQAVLIGVLAGAVYALARQLGAPLCAPTAVSCAVQNGGALLAVQLGGVATALALPVLALRAGLSWAFTVLATAGLLVLNTLWFVSMSDMWTVFR
ncbi:hypothetical protein [Kribbella sp. NPDC004536]|uniref:hypothetical protein n=1 Tax=Kribbella sp. NPDC004536 TaxID=3364106 RepID=UPI00368DC47E